MNSRGLIVVAAISFALIGNSFGKTAGCPCSPCKCAPCTCGGGGSSKSGGGKHHDDHHDHHGHDHGGGGGVGVGGTVDLSGIGHREREADPFAVGGGEKPVARTEEKHPAKHKDHEPKTTAFDDIKLTGKEGKGDLPPNTFNVDNEEAPKLPPRENFTPKAPSDPMDDLQKTWEDYAKARRDWLQKQPNWNGLLNDWLNSPDTAEGNEKSAKAKKKIDKLIDQFNGGDGKKLVDDWKTAFDNALKSGGTVDDNTLIPPPRDDIEKKKYAVMRAQNDLKYAQTMYDDKRRNAASQSDEVKKATKAVSDLKPNDPGYKGAVADLDKAINDAGAKWAATDEGKAEAKKLHDAEKDLDKAKEAWKPFEKYVGK